METPSTLLEAIRIFANPDVAREFVVALRWPNGVACPRMGCGSADIQWIATRKLWRCKDCKRQFTAKVGTIFEDSPIGFDKWLPAMWLLSSAKNGISSLELHRAIGVTQKTAWFMLHRLRLAMQAESFELMTGPVEIDETYIGPKHRREPLHKAERRKSKGPSAGKTVVMGIVERGGRVTAKVVPNSREVTLLLKIRETVAAGATVYTDALVSYRNLDRHDYAHYVINHAQEYVRGHVHTNSIENFWSVLKRTLGGTYICASPKHLDRYLDEQIYRYNERENTDGPRFAKAVKGADMKRLTYKKLIGKD